MKLLDYELKDWKDKRIKKKIKIKGNILVLLHLDRKVLPPEDGRKNLLLIDNDSSILWIADLPTMHFDSYVYVNYYKGVLTAHSSNGFNVIINIDNGKLLNKKLSH